MAMSLIAGLLRLPVSKTAHCESCGQDVSDIAPIRASNAPGFYCSDECVSLGNANYAW